MFKLYRNTRRYNNKTFASYEDARNYARKVIRKTMRVRNPVLSQMGFRVVAEQ